MKKIMMLLWLVVCGVAWAEERFRTKLTADLNGDGRPEVIRLIPYNVGETTLGQLVVEDSRGRVLWKGPRFSDAFSADPFRFLGEFDRGDLEFVGDFNGDGRIDLVATEQKSDVRPTVFKIFHWDGRRFVFDRAGMLVPRSQKPATFDFEKADPSRTRWVDEIHATGRQFTLKISDLKAQSGASEKAVWVKGEGFVIRH